MKKSQKVQFIIKTLDELFPIPRIPLRHNDPYTLLVAVVLSAQCTDKRVNQIAPKLFARADTPRKMKKMTPGQIEDIIRPCGLGAAKSKAIHGLSCLLVEKFGGKVPDNFKDLEDLPGVGHKTASVVMSHAFGVPAFPVDTHIHRLMHRWGLSKGSTVEQTERDCKRLFPEKLWERLHLQMIYFGRGHCPARGHDEDNCPICGKIK
ncbi:endonuclease III [Fibrobacterota bacterium]